MGLLLTDFKMESRRCPNWYGSSAEIPGTPARRGDLAGIGIRTAPGCRVILALVRLLVACHFALDEVDVCLAVTLSNLRAPDSVRLMAQMGDRFSKNLLDHLGVAQEG